MKVTNKQIREYLGHNSTGCKVVIKRDGTISRYGSSDPYDRSKDYWYYMGTREEIVKKMGRYK